MPTTFTQVLPDGSFSQRAIEPSANIFANPKAKVTAREGYDCIIGEGLPPRKTTGMLGITGIPVSATTTSSDAYAVANVRSLQQQIGHMLRNPEWVDLTFNHPVFPVKSFYDHARPLWIYGNTHGVTVSFKDKVHLAINVQAMTREFFEEMSKKHGYGTMEGNSDAGFQVRTACEAVVNGCQFTIEAPNQDFISAEHIHTPDVDLSILETKVTRFSPPPLANDITYRDQFMTNRGAVVVILPIDNEGATN